MMFKLKIFIRHVNEKRIFLFLNNKLLTADTAIPLLVLLLNIN